MLLKPHSNLPFKVTMKYEISLSSRENIVIINQNIKEKSLGNIIFRTFCLIEEQMSRYFAENCRQYFIKSIKTFNTFSF